MTPLALFTALADITTALQGECARLRFSPHRLALDEIRERLDRVIDKVVAEGIDEEEDKR